MKRRILIIAILIVIVTGAALVWYFCCKSIGNGLARQQHRVDNDACVKDALRYSNKALLALHTQLLSSLNNQARPQEKEGPEERYTEEFVIPKIATKNDQFRQELACLYLPFKIENGDIDNYPNTPDCFGGKPKPTPTPPPPSIEDNKPQILELAKSVGRIGIRRSGSQAYPAFWGTGFLVASSQTPDLIVTACHVMDPVMTLEGGKHHLHLDGEELLVDFKYGANYDYQCPIKDVVACSSQEGVDVALLSLDTSKCNGSGTLPSGAILDSNEPHGTVSVRSKDKLEDCRASLGNSCLAMIAYADIDHPIDGPTNHVYGVYQDQTQSDFQFAMNDDVAKVEKCDGEPNVEIMMDVATTTVGESGGVLTYFDRTTGGRTRKSKSGDPLIVSGMHTCCSAFFNYSGGETPPASDKSCAHLRRTLDNQAISTWSMLKDHDICTGLKDHHAVFSSGIDCK